ncbi:MAG: YcxB family protein [bacterium]|nr:YcxB family protein [bacterium]
MKYELQITYDDYKSAMRCHVAPRRVFKFLLYALLAAMLAPYALGCLLAFSAFLTGDGRVFHALAFGAVSWALLFGYMALLFGVLRPYRWRKNYRQQKLFRKPIQYEFTEAKFLTSGDYGNTAIPWHEFHKWEEGKHVFLVYVSDVLLTIIPKRIFASQEEQEQLRSYLTNGIGKPVL